jgi:hypothetical protein
MKLRNRKTTRPNGILLAARVAWMRGVWRFRHPRVVTLGLLAIFRIVGPIAAQDSCVVGSLPSGAASSVFGFLAQESATGNYLKIVQRMPVHIDFDRVARQDFNAEGLLEPGLSVEPDLRVR